MDQNGTAELADQARLSQFNKTLPFGAGNGWTSDEARPTSALVGAHCAVQTSEQFPH